MNAQVEALLKPLAATATDLAGYRVTITAKATATTDLNGRDGFTVCGGTVVAEGEDAGGTTEEVVIVTTASTAAVEAGATTIDLADVSQITVGDSLTIGKGDDAETAVVAAITLTRARSRREGHAVAVAGTVELTAPLKNAHAEGAKITFEAATKEEEVTDAPVTEAPDEQLSEAEEEAAAAADAAAAAAAGDSGHTVTAIVLVIVLTLVLGVLLSVYLIRNQTPDVAGLGSTGAKPPCNEPETAYGNKENPAFGLDARAASISA
jgi:hypothetical protein